MVKEKQGKPLSLRRVDPRLLLNHPSALLYYARAKKIAPYSMLSFTALWNLTQYLTKLHEKKIEGAIVELGCWKGGCGAFMTRVAKDLGDSRPVWLFDSFEGLPDLTQEDKSWADSLDVSVRAPGAERKSIGLYVASIEDVKEALERLHVSSEDVHIEKGWFQDSVPRVKSAIGKIALLRLDGDTYESTKYSLEALYDNVVENGYVVIDDYHLEGCRKALNEFFHTKGIAPFVFQEPYGGRAYFIKRLS